MCHACMHACTSLYYDPSCSSFRILPVDGHRRKSMWAICQDTRSVAHDDKHFQVSEEIPNFVLDSSIGISGEKLVVLKLHWKISERLKKNFFLRICKMSARKNSIYCMSLSRLWFTTLQVGQKQSKGQRHFYPEHTPTPTLNPVTPLIMYVHKSPKLYLCNLYSNCAVTIPRNRLYYYPLSVNSAERPPSSTIEFQ